MKIWLVKHYILTSGLLLLFGFPFYILFGASTGICTNCEALSENALIITLKEIDSCPQKFENKVIRISSILHHDSGEIFLSENWQEKPKYYIPAGLGKDFTSCTSTRRAVSFNTGYQTWYDGSAQVTIIGKFGIIDDQTGFHDDRIGITILCFEKVSPVNFSSLNVNRVRYIIARIGRLFFPMRESI